MAGGPFLADGLADLLRAQPADEDGAEENREEERHERRVRRPQEALDAAAQPGGDLEQELVVGKLPERLVEAHVELAHGLRRAHPRRRSTPRKKGKDHDGTMPRNQIPPESR